MSIVREHINEKFIKDSDPIKDMGIGFDPVQEIRKVDRNIELRPLSKNTYVCYYYHGTIPSYIDYELAEATFRYNILRAAHKINWKNIEVVPYYNKNKVIKGVFFKYKIIIKNKKVNEKFIEHSDPIKDLGIGIYAFWRKEARRIGKYTERSFWNEYVNDPNYDINYCFGWFVWYVLHNIKQNSDPQLAFDEAAYNTSSKYRKNKRFRKKAAEILKKHFYISVNPNLNEHYNINEKFVEDSDPIHDMDIGIKGALLSWIKENDNEDLLNGDASIFSSIIQDYDLEDSVKKAFIEYILSTDDPIFELSRDTAVSELSEDYDDFIHMVNIGIKFVPYLGLPSYFDYIYKNQQHYVLVSNLEDFSELFSSNRDIDKKTITTILAGESFELFDAYDNNYDLADVKDMLTNDEENELLNILKPICVKINNDVKDIDNLHDLFHFMPEDHDFNNIIISLTRALCDTVASSQEEEAYNDLLHAIESTFDINYLHYNHNNQKHVFRARESSLDRIFIATYFPDNEGIDYKPPYYGYSGEFLFKSYLERLNDQFEYHNIG